MDKQAIIELLKSFGRFVWFGLLALVGTFLTSLLTSGDIANITISILGQTIDLTLLVLAVIGFVIKGIDLYIRKSDNNDLNGIAPTFLQK